MESRSGVVTSGVVTIDYGHFSVDERLEEGFDDVQGEVSFRRAKPVIVTSGRIVITSQVQSHDAPVTLVLSDTDARPPHLGEDWHSLGRIRYRPVYGGVMEVWGCTTGPATPRVALALAPDRTYTVHAYAKGRESSAERFAELLERGVYDVSEGFEEYTVVFSPVGRG
ncbi:hypothetical protein [Streptomyces sp. NPDC059063]|uniref:hypothetical protein n=1 Tax=unclassified Streptomyces TaxID=2593676 RepID=UPI0036A34480